VNTVEFEQVGRATGQVVVDSDVGNTVSDMLVSVEVGCGVA
jgi:hypothetical protein